MSLLPVTAALLIDEEGRVLLTKRPMGDGKLAKWEFPGGKIESGESPEECLRREIAEELGIKVKVGDIFHAVIHRYPQGEVLLLAYLCDLEEGMPRPLEHLDLEWVRPDQLKDYDLMDADRPIARKLEALWRSSQNRRWRSAGGNSSL